MKKFFYIGGGSVLLLLALLCGAFFASPLVASAHSASGPNAAQKSTGNKHDRDGRPLREFVRNHSNEIVSQIAPQLHLSSSQLTQKLQSGERLVKIAKEQGISTASLKTIIVNSVNTVVSQELSAGKIDQNRANLLKTLVQKHPLVVAHVLHRHYHKK